MSQPHVAGEHPVGASQREGGIGVAATIRPYQIRHHVQLARRALHLAAGSPFELERAHSRLAQAFQRRARRFGPCVAARRRPIAAPHRRCRRLVGNRDAAVTAHRLGAIAHLAAIGALALGMHVHREAAAVVQRAIEPDARGSA
jgi:hypothetical protein